MKYQRNQNQKLQDLTQAYSEMIKARKEDQAKIGPTIRTHEHWLFRTGAFGAEGEKPKRP